MEGCKNKKRIKKVTIKMLMIFIVVMFFCIPSSVFASDDELLDVIGGSAGTIVTTAFSGLIGVMTLGLKFTILITTLIIQAICSIVLSIADTQILVFSPDTILFNKVNLLDINFFENSSSFFVNSASSAMGVIKQNIANWYTTFRVIASAALLLILAYVAIRMAISTLSQDKAKYKKMFQHWFESFALLQVLHYIMIIVIYLNNGIVEILDGINSTSGEVGYSAAALATMALNFTLTGLAATICYAIFVGITAVYFIIYLKRMLVVGFLIAIAPLITITYSIDKLGDGKSQALNTWLKLFMYNVLIQPFHCIIYLVFVTAAFKLTAGSLSGQLGSIAACILAVASMLFMSQGEKIVKEIFGFNQANDSLLDGIVAGKLMGKVVNPAVKGISKKVNKSKLGQSVQKGQNKIRGSIGNIKYGKKDPTTGKKKRIGDTKVGGYIDNKIQSAGNFLDKNADSIIVGALIGSSDATAGFTAAMDGLEKTLKETKNEKAIKELESVIKNEIRNLRNSVPGYSGKTDDAIVKEAFALTRKERLNFQNSGDPLKEGLATIATKLNSMDKILQFDSDDKGSYERMNAIIDKFKNTP